MEPESQDQNRPFVSAPMSEHNKRFPKISNKVRLIIAATLVVLVAGGVAWALIANANKSAQIAAKQTAGPTVSITMEGVAPATIKIKEGQEVTWSNNDTREHRLTADQSSLPGFDSVETLLTGDSYTFTFDELGTYRYYDPTDPKVYSGVVVVE